MGSHKSAAIFVGFSAVILGMLQTHCPPSELMFAHITCFVSATQSLYYNRFHLINY